MPCVPVPFIQCFSFVILALINGGFNHGDGKWRLVWLENLLRYVESAEEMSYHITGNLPNALVQFLFFFFVPSSVRS